MSKTIAGAIQIAYSLEPILIQGWLDYVSISDGKMIFDIGTKFNQASDFHSHVGFYAPVDFANGLVTITNGSLLVTNGSVGSPNVNYAQLSNSGVTLTAKVSGNIDTQTILRWGELYYRKLNQGDVYVSIPHISQNNVAETITAEKTLQSNLVLGDSGKIYLDDDKMNYIDDTGMYFNDGEGGHNRFTYFSGDFDAPAFGRVGAYHLDIGNYLQFHFGSVIINEDYEEIRIPSSGGTLALTSDVANIFSTQNTWNGTQTFNSSCAFNATTTFAQKVTFNNNVDHAAGTSASFYSNNGKTVRIGGGGINAEQVATGTHEWGWYGPNKIQYTYQTSGAPYSYDLFFPKKGGTLALTSDVDTAQQTAITTSNNYADGKIQQAITDLTQNDANFAGNVTIGGDLTVNGTMTSVDTQTISTHERYIQMMKGNTVAVSGYTGTVWPRYDGVHDFFSGLQGEVNVLGKVTATLNASGDVIDITPISLIPLAGRADESLLTNGNLLMWDSATKKLVDSGLNPATLVSDWTTIKNYWDNTIAPTWATIADADAERFRIRPFPMSQADYDHVHDDGYYVCLLANGTQVVSQAPAQNAVYAYQYQVDAVYDITDDTEIQEMLATVSEAQEYIENQVFLTAEQYAELEREGEIDPSKNYYIEDNSLYEELTVTIPAQEEQRQLNEQVRVSFLEWQITKYPWPVSSADMVKLSANGVFGVHMTGSGTSQTPVCTVYDSVALAEAADETWVFPMQSDVIYPSLD